MSSRLNRFRIAMQDVYGSFERIRMENAADWTPPPNSGGHRGRYLWTDAFGVLNFLTLYKETNQAKYLDFAKRLTQTVHDVLGCTRDGASRLPGATDQNALGGGLRIGKIDAEGPDGDGQYHHYLTLWMFALNRVSVAAEDRIYNDQAISLARAIHPHFFLRRKTPNPRMVWKISTDMSRPLVASQGHLDATTGYVVFQLLQATANEGPILGEEISDYKRVMDLTETRYESNDTLDLGMALWIAHWCGRTETWAEDMSQSCVRSLHRIFSEERYAERTLVHRLAFREFGALMGIECYGHDDYLNARAPLILALWEKHIAELTPEDLMPITLVMYASALLPTAFRNGGLHQQPEQLDTS
ncbi:uncharacterized protein V1513DRAFT_454995 [Lipomyces chichibuensis]|uniref:uncharacterized protein n=1 Tax=Lipomyces chichibuensis TaxID=1546026 RepID=UPI0033439E06